MSNLDSWFNSDEGKESVEKLIASLKEEEELSAKLERESTLKYKDGQKVLIGDVFLHKIDGEEDEVYEYVYRINEDNTIDSCLYCSFAHKMNGTNFDSERSVLIQRNGELYNPLDDLFGIVNKIK